MIRADVLRAGCGLAQNAPARRLVPARLPFSPAPPDARNMGNAAGRESGSGPNAMADVFVSYAVMKPAFSIAWFLKRDPFKNAADAARLAASLRLAGLPE